MPPLSLQGPVPHVRVRVLRVSFDWEGDTLEHFTCVDCGLQYTTRTFTVGAPRVCLACDTCHPLVPHCYRCQEPGKAPLCAGCEKVLSVRRMVVLAKTVEKAKSLWRPHGRDDAA